MFAVNIDDRKALNSLRNLITRTILKNSLKSIRIT